MCGYDFVVAALGYVQMSTMRHAQSRRAFAAGARRIQEVRISEQLMHHRYADN